MRRIAFGLVVLFLLAACTTTHIGPVGPGVTGVERRHFTSADAFIRALNQRGVRCKGGPADPHPGPTAFRYRDFDICNLANGDVLNVWIVKDAEQVYRRHFAGTHGPSYILFRANWLAILPNTAPANVVSTIRGPFRAAG
jgi:hypothetical protein